VLISVTDFRADRRRDLPGVLRAGGRVRRALPQLPDAVGMWLWTEPWRGRCGSVSVWRDETVRYHFVGRADYVEIMRRYRDRGSIKSTTCNTPAADRDAIWSRAWLHLRGAQLPQNGQS
jgi:hypothetical protein